jgi:putative tricarboxylic transport membrane protein
MSQQEEVMKQRDLVSSIVWMVLGGLFVVGSLQQGLMRKEVPGPGFLPFLSGIALIVVSLFVLIPAILKGKEDQRSALFPDRHSFRKLLFALTALFGYGIALEYVGYLLTTFLFMFSIGRLVEPRGWWTTTVVALLTAVLSYLLFIVLLEVQLPKGPLGF